MYLTVFTVYVVQSNIEGRWPKFNEWRKSKPRRGEYEFDNTLFDYMKGDILVEGSDWMDCDYVSMLYLYAYSLKL